MVRYRARCRRSRCRARRRIRRSRNRQIPQALRNHSNQRVEQVDQEKLGNSAQAASTSDLQLFRVKKEPSAASYFVRVVGQTGTIPKVTVTKPIIKSEPVDSIEQSGKFAVKRKRFDTNVADGMKCEKVDFADIKDDLPKCLKSCSEITKVLVSNLPTKCSQADLLRNFGHYKSLASTYRINPSDESQTTAAAELIFNDSADAMKVVKDYDGSLFDDCHLLLKVDLISSTRKYEYGSPLNIIHYQVVENPTLFRCAGEH